MWSNRLIKGRYLCLALTFMAGSADRCAAIDTVAATSPVITSAPPAIVLAQKISDRDNDQTKIPNTAKVSLQMSPDRTVPVGTRISFRVTTRKAGYLLLVDIDADG